MANAAPRLGIQPRVELRTTLRRRMPSELVDLIEKGEGEFAQFVADVEQDPLYRRLREAGYLMKVSMRGRIPMHKYTEYLDEEMIKLIYQSGISQRPGWFEEFSGSTTRLRVLELSRKHRLSEDHTRRIMRYLNHLRRDDSLPAGLVQRPPDEAEEMGSEAAAVPTDSGEGCVEICARFVEQYGIGQEDFVLDFLQGECSPAELAHKYGAPLAEVEKIVSALASMEVYDIYVGSQKRPPAHRYRETHSSAAADRDIVAAVEFDNATGVPRLAVFGEEEYAQTYRLHPEAVSALYRWAEDRRQAEDLLRRLRWINQRKGLVHRLLTGLFRRQFRYFATGDELQLRPYSQSQLARDLGEDESTICRAIRNKSIAFQDRKISLKDLCESKTNIVQRLVLARPEMTDRELTDILTKEYQCEITRRTVAYHRAKAQRLRPDLILRKRRRTIAPAGRMTE